jgi:hypothetical protein
MAKIDVRILGRIFLEVLSKTTLKMLAYFPGQNYGATQPKFNNRAIIINKSE